MQIMNLWRVLKLSSHNVWNRDLELKLQFFKDLSIFLITKFERWISDTNYKFMKILQAFKLHKVRTVDLEFEIQVFEDIFQVSESKRLIDKSRIWIIYISELNALNFEL